MYHLPPDAMESEDDECDGDEPELDLPEWSNSAEAVPPQEERSCVSRAAFELRYTQVDVAAPRGFEPRKRRAPPPVVWKAGDAQMALVCEGFLARACLTAVDHPAKLALLLKAERAELLAADGQGPTDAHAAPPRAFALTVLVRDSALCTGRVALLDAAGHWARCGGAERAASVCRMTVLADECARAYAAHHRLRPGPTPMLVLAWAAPGCDLVVRAEAVELPNASSGAPRACLDELVRSAAALFRDAEQEPPPAVVRCFGDADELPDEPLHGAYAAAVKGATDAFWERVFLHVPFEPIETKLDFEHHRTFVKLVPDPQKHHPPPAREQFACGLLAYAKDMHEEARDFCLRATREEKESHPLRPSNVPYGLRFPRDADEHALRLHVLQLSTDYVSLQGEVSAYAPRAAPGKPVSLYPNAQVPRLVFQLLRFDEKFCEGKYVLPLGSTKQLDSDNRFEHTSQWDAFDHAVTVRYRDAWGLQAGADGAAAGADRFRLAKRYRPHNREEALAASLFGVARGDAAGLGDVYAQFRKLGGASRHVDAFLTAAIADHGADAPVAQALAAMARASKEHSKRSAALAKALESKRYLEQRVQELEQRKAPIASAPAPLVKDLLAALKRRPKKGRVIAEPVAGAAVTTVVFAYANARGAPEDKAEARWGKKHVGALPTFDAICKVVGQLEHGPVVLMRLGADGDADFLKARSEGRAAERITFLEAMRLNAEGGTAFLQFDSETVKLSPLLRVGGAASSE